MMVGSTLPVTTAAGDGVIVIDPKITVGFTVAVTNGACPVAAAVPDRLAPTST
jgi:hypothetical protein